MLLISLIKYEEKFSLDEEKYVSHVYKIRETRFDDEERFLDMAAN